MDTPKQCLITAAMLYEAIERTCGEGKCRLNDTPLANVPAPAFIKADIRNDLGLSQIDIINIVHYVENAYHICIKSDYWYCQTIADFLALNAVEVPVSEN